MNLDPTSRGAGAGAVYTNASTGTGSAVALSPESLVALCAMQLQKFDNDILDRMNEKDKNMKLQEKLAALTSTLEGLGQNGIGPNDAGARRTAVEQIDALLTECGTDPSKADLKAQLEAQKNALTANANPDNHAASNAAYQDAVKTKDQAYAKLGGEAGEQQVETIARPSLNLSGDMAATLQGSPNLDEDQKAAVVARVEEHRAYLAAEKDAMGDGSLSPEAVKSLLEYTKAAGASLSSRNDTIMMELQSLVSQRSTSIQMTSNLANSLLEATKSIAANIGR